MVMVDLSVYTNHRMGDNIICCITTSPCQLSMIMLVLDCLSLGGVPDVFLGCFLELGAILGLKARKTRSPM